MYLDQDLVLQLLWWWEDSRNGGLLGHQISEDFLQDSGHRDLTLEAAVDFQGEDHRVASISRKRKEDVSREE